jgi:hypothetical protein
MKLVFATTHLSRVPPHCPSSVTITVVVLNRLHQMGTGMISVGWSKFAQHRDVVCMQECPFAAPVPIKPIGIWLGLAA